MMMGKNLIISTLIIIIAILVGILILTNYDWFSQEWLIGLGIVIVGGVVEGVLIYFKIKK